MIKVKFIKYILFTLISTITQIKTSSASDIITNLYDFHRGNIFMTVDGTIFKKIDLGDVGNLDYRQEIMFLSSKIVCINGKVHRIKLIELGSNNHYSSNKYQGKEAYKKILALIL